MRELKPDGAMPVYLMYPRFLLELDMNDTAKMVYLLLYDRARLSMQNGWLDEDGRVYVYYTEGATFDMAVALYNYSQASEAYIA